MKILTIGYYCTRCDRYWDRNLEWDETHEGADDLTQASRKCETCKGRGRFECYVWPIGMEPPAHDKQGRITWQK